MANADLSTRRGLLLLWPVCVIDGLDAYFGFGSQAAVDDDARSVSSWE